jgi:lipoate-protein ligase A
LGSSRASDYKASGGKLVRIRLTEQDGRIHSIQVSGDFFLVPEDSLSTLERMLEGVKLQELDVRERIDQFFETSQAKSLGISPNDLVHALLSTVEEAVTAIG